MDQSSKIALAVISSVVFGVLVYVGYQEYARRRDIDEAKVALRALAEGSQRAVHAYQRQQGYEVEEAARRERVAHSEDIRRRELLPGQRCIGGTVVLVSGNAYTQILGWGDRPVPCSGGLAFQPIRS